MYSAAYQISIEKLTRDFVYSSGQVAIVNSTGGSLFTEYFVEAPTMFERAGVYYVVFGHCCCFCYQGSGLFVHTASHPLGPYTPQAGGNIACDAAVDATTSHDVFPGVFPDSRGVGECSLVVCEHSR